MILTEDRVKALEKAKQDKEAHGEIETMHPGYLGAQDTYYVGTIQGVGRIYQQTSSIPTRRSPSPSSMTGKTRWWPRIFSTTEFYPSWKKKKFRCYEC